jgi:hypothetical protein
MKYENYSTNTPKVEKIYNIFLENPWRIYSA